MLLAKQGSNPVEGQHFWSRSDYYAKCQRCGIGNLKRSRQEVLDEFMQQPCHNSAWQGGEHWKGHKSQSHCMWRRANQVHCKQCNGKATLFDGEFQASQKLVHPCKEVKESKQPSVVSFFKGKWTQTLKWHSRGIPSKVSVLGDWKVSPDWADGKEPWKKIHDSKKESETFEKRNHSKYVSNFKQSWKLTCFVQFYFRKLHHARGNYLQTASLPLGKFAVPLLKVTTSTLWAEVLLLSMPWAEATKTAHFQTYQAELACLDCGLSNQNPRPH